MKRTSHLERIKKSITENDENSFYETIENLKQIECDSENSVHPYENLLDETKEIVTEMLPKGGKVAFRLMQELSDISSLKPKLKSFLEELKQKTSKNNSRIQEKRIERLIAKLAQ